MVVTWRGIGMFCHVLLCIVSCMASGVMFFRFCRYRVITILASQIYRTISHCD